MVLIAAYESTANLLANVLRTVLVAPRFRAQLNAGQMTVPEAVEQLLWCEPPFSTIFAYFAKQETELGGRRIRRGDGLLLAPARSTWTCGYARTRPPTCRATAPTWPSAAVRASAPGRTSGVPSPRPASTCC
ncbi:hypothetical protein [Streptomyces sp. KMM 9044]|uniref:hypothetical protein n=1 Tax=Streptomyces sp. KMM 9044 TaxID=2744474 RepID=UPI003FA6F59E